MDDPVGDGEREGAYLVIVSYVRYMINAVIAQRSEYAILDSIMLLNNKGAF